MIHSAEYFKHNTYALRHWADYWRFVCKQRGEFDIFHNDAEIKKKFYKRHHNPLGNY